MSLLEPDDAADGGAPDDDATDLGNEGELPDGATKDDDPMPTTPSPPD